MYVITIIGLTILIAIQYRLFRIENTGTFRQFFKSKLMLEIIKECLILTLSVTVAVNFANIQEKTQRADTVRRLLESVYTETERDYIFNSLYQQQYEKGELLPNALKSIIVNHNELLENVLQSDSVIISMSPTLYGFINNHVQIRDFAFETLNSIEDNSEQIELLVAMINSHSENILWALEKEIDHLCGKYPERALIKEVESFYAGKYIQIDERNGLRLD